MDGTGDILPWRDILHDGPVPAGLSLAGLSRVRAKFLGSEGFGDTDELQRDLAERDDTLRRYAVYDEVILWFEWDLYDQLQLIQILDFFSSTIRERSASLARYIERMSLHPNPLMTYPPGDSIYAPSTEEDSRLFRNAEMCVTTAGFDVLRGDRDWIAMGGSDRGLGGVHLDGSETPWRWDTEKNAVVESRPAEPQ